MLRFISFGSGSSGNCYYLFTGTDGLLIDAGVGVRALKKYCRDYGLSLSDVHHLLITHDHADHIKCVGSLSHEYNLPVYATSIVHQGIDRNYSVSRKIAAGLRRFITPGEVLELGDFRVTPFSVPHDSSDNVGFEVQVGDVNFCIITDAGCITPEMASFISRANYLVIEANHDSEMLQQGPYPQHLKVRIASTTGHLNNYDCGEAIAQNMTERLRHVFLCHLSAENNHPELARKSIEAVLRQYGIIAGKDFQFDILKRTLPTGLFDLV